ncbi:MAG: cobalamin biosynthesis protein CbiD [Stomatobaculum sp.]|nr:cobalamin biosynthesis protein CbiD [Stomatobaculum sp.]
MELKEYIEKGGRKLRLGYTTGSCAAAAAKAAAVMLLTGKRVSQVQLKTPKGLELYLEVEDICVSSSAVSCAVRKDSGDDPDITNHALIFAKVAYSRESGIRIDGGDGVGRVTRPGLDQPVGNAAINSTPRRMIEEAVQEAVRSAGIPPAFSGTGDQKGFDVTISVPGGRELAAKTFNPKLGVEGGISILGTSGIVEPMSDQALLDTIRVELNIRRQESLAVLPAAPGNYGRDFLEAYGISPEDVVISSNFIYDTVRMAAEAGFSGMLFAGHIGKMVKVAGGIRNTHSRYGDHRMEILTEITKEVLKNKEEIPLLQNCVTADDAVRILKERGLDQAVLQEMTRRIRDVMQEWAQGDLRVEVVVFSNTYGEIGRSEGAEEYLRILKTSETDTETERE